MIIVKRLTSVFAVLWRRSVLGGLEDGEAIPNDFVAAIFFWVSVVLLWCAPFRTGGGGEGGKLQAPKPGQR